MFRKCSCFLSIFLYELLHKGRWGREKGGFQNSSKFDKSKNRVLYLIAFFCKFAKWAVFFGNAYVISDQINKTPPELVFFTHKKALLGLTFSKTEPRSDFSRYSFEYTLFVKLIQVCPFYLIP